jgi:hypothetical protein
MNNKGPVEKAEEIVKNLNDSAGGYTKPVFKRYPLLFALLLTFGATSIVEGLRFFFEEIIFFKEHPFVLVLIGILILLLTGTLYKKLDKID